MQNQSFSIALETEETPAEVFNVIKNVRSWWSGFYGEKFEGTSENIGDEFSFRAGDGAHYSKQKLVALIPDKKVVWLVTESNLTFLENTSEWTGTKIGFDISVENDKTKIVFTHHGLTPHIECYNSCAPAWTNYLKNLYSLSQ